MVLKNGIPMEIVTDGGKEFCAKVSEEVIKRMGATHLKTAPYHPQCNSQAEVANKTIADYLTKYVDQTTLDWELYIALLMFAYNTSFHLLNSEHATLSNIWDPSKTASILPRRFEPKILWREHHRQVDAKITIRKTDC